MGTRRGRLAGAGLLLAGTLALSSCASKPAPAAAGASVPPDVTPLVSIKELMENIIDPISDNIFDAVGTDVTAKGVVETKPVSDDDWAKVRQGAVTLAEGTNLLKLPRRVAPPGDKNKSTGPNAPELSPEDIERIHRLWVDAVKAVGPAIHHRDVVAAALGLLEKDLSGPQRDQVLARLREQMRGGGSS